MDTKIEKLKECNKAKNKLFAYVEIKKFIKEKRTSSIKKVIRELDRLMYQQIEKIKKNEEIL